MTEIYPDLARKALENSGIPEENISENLELLTFSFIACL